MKNIINLLREKSSQVDGILFVLIIISSLGLFFLAQAGSTFFLGVVLVIIVLANLLVILIR